MNKGVAQLTNKVYHYAPPNLINQYQANLVKKHQANLINKYQHIPLHRLIKQLTLCRAGIPIER